MSGLENPSDAQTKHLGLEPTLRYTKACNRVPVIDEASTGQLVTEDSQK